MSRDDLPSLKARIRLSSVIGKSVKLKHRGGDWWGVCPFHSEKTGSFSVNDAKSFFHCFGCGAHGDVLDWWRLIDGLSLPDAIDRLKHVAGEARPWRDELRSVKSDDGETRRKRDQALAIWQATEPLAGTMAETYLRSSRAIQIAPPQSLRFHPGLSIGGPDGDLWPAMVAAVSDLAGNVIAIQRTFLARDGSSKARIDSPKRSLAPLAEGAVRLGEPMHTLGVAEGIETGLSAMERFLVPVWCALGSNLARIALPDQVRNVVIFADRGEAGEDAADKARTSFRQRGRAVAVRFPSIGKDFNDELKAMRRGA
jgi:DNA primase